MTKQELSHHGELKKQLSICREYAATLEAAARPGAQRLTGLPRVPGFRDKVGDLVVRIADTRAKVTRLERELYRSEAAITAYVGTIPDSRTRIHPSVAFRARHGLEGDCPVHWRRYNSCVCGAAGAPLLSTDFTFYLGVPGGGPCTA